MKRQLKIVNGEISYLSDADDQSYGAWCPVSYDCYHRFKEGETLVVGEELEAKIKELEQALDDTNKELCVAIEEVNNHLAESVTSSTENEPDYWDFQTVYDNQVLLSKPQPTEVK